MAASTGAIKAGRAWVEVSADTSKLAAGLRAGEAKLASFAGSLAKTGAQMAALGAVRVAALAAAGNLFAQAGSDLYRLSQTTGMSTTALSAWQYAAEKAGVSADAVGQAFGKMQDLTVAAARGEEGAINSMRALGVNLKQLERMDAGQRLDLVADAMGRIENVAVRRTLIEQTLGDPDTFIPLLSKGKEGLRALREEAVKKGLTIDPAEAEAADKLRQGFVELASVSKRLATVVGGAVAPALRDALGWLSSVITPVSKWLKANGGLLSSLFKLSLGVVGFGAALLAGAAIVKVLAVGLGILGTVVAGVGAVLSFALSPFGLVIGAAVLGAVAFVKFTSAGQQMAGLVSKAFATMGEDVGVAWGGIKAAFASGDLSAVLGIAMKLVQSIWTQAIAYLSDTWLGLKNYVLDTADALYVNVAKGALAGWAAVQSVWDTATTALLDAVGGLVGMLEDVWAKYFVWLRAAWTESDGYLARAMVRVSGWVSGQSRDDIERAAADVDQQVAQKKADQVREATAEAQAERSAARDKAVRQRAEASAARQAGLQAGLDKSFAGLDAGKAARGAERANVRAASADAGMAAIADARKALAAVAGGAVARGKILEGVENLAAKRTVARKGQRGRNTDRDLKIAGLDGQKQSVVGTFNASALNLMGGGSAPERTARNTERTAKGVEAMAAGMVAGGPLGKLGVWSQ